jgi:rsbT co-antagonist protein RsbR
LQEARNTVRDMSSPVIPVLDGVLVVPLIGAIDETRADELSENVLNAVERERARYVILDVTGLPIIDTHAARSLMQASHAVRLLGAQTMLAGIRPEVAQTLVSLGVDLSDVPAYAGLREAVAMLARNQVQPGVRG